MNLPSVTVSAPHTQDSCGHVVSTLGHAVLLTGSGRVLVVVQIVRE